jgi:hypothetical protein
MKILFGILFIILTNKSFGSDAFNHCEESFDIIDGDTINYMDTNCVKHGHWDMQYQKTSYTSRIIGEYENGLEVGNWTTINKHETYHEFTITGKYILGKKNGLWITYDSDKHVTNKDEYKNGVLMKEIIVSKGKDIVINKKNYLSYLIERYSNIYVIIILGSFWLRTFINSLIYNTLEKTSFFIFFKSPWNLKARYHGISSMLTFHWKITVNDDLRIEKKISNFLSYLFGITFIVTALNFIIETIINYY